MKGKQAQKNFGAVGARAQTPLSLKKKPPGGGGGWRGSHTRTGPGRPPPPCVEPFKRTVCCNQLTFIKSCVWKTTLLSNKRTDGNRRNARVKGVHCGARMLESLST